jgi:hypothetical protein
MRHRDPHDDPPAKRRPERHRGPPMTLMRAARSPGGVSGGYGATIETAPFFGGKAGRF